jgi:hypothetical protein
MKNKIKMNNWVMPCFVFVILILIGCNYNQSELKNTLSELKLKGQVKYFEETKYFTNDEYELGAPSSRTTYLFDKKGYVLEKLEYGSFGYLESKETYKYNDLSNLIEISRLSKVGIQSELRKYNYEYDNLGRKLHLFISVNDTIKSIYRYKYDVFNNEAEGIELNPKMQYVGIIYKNEFDSIGNCIRRMNFTEDGKIHMVEKYVYDAKRNLIRFTTLDSQGTIEYDEENKYDEIGYPKEKIEYLPNGALLVRDYYENKEFDQFSNWTKNVRKREMIGATFGHPNIQEIRLRKFEYFQN